MTDPVEIAAERARLLEQVELAERWIADPDTIEELREAARGSIANYRRALAALPEIQAW